MLCFLSAKRFFLDEHLWGLVNTALFIDISASGLLCIFTQSSSCLQRPNIINLSILDGCLSSLLTLHVFCSVISLLRYRIPNYRWHFMLWLSVIWWRDRSTLTFSLVSLVTCHCFVTLNFASVTSQLQWWLIVLLVCTSSPHQLTTYI